MIKQDELRKGNKLIFNTTVSDSEQVYITVLEILRAGIIDTKNNGFSYDRLNPIPLAHDIFIKNEFDFDPRSKEYSFGDFTVRPLGSGYVFLNGMDGGKIYRYIHEIQNLYHALFGKECEINL